MDKKVRIYIVEDMAITRAYLEDNLNSNGYEVAGSSAKAESAWLEIQELEIDLILLDINLAGEKDGIWLAQKVRSTMDKPIVYLTAFGDKATIDSVIETKPNGYLMKPYNVPSLLTTIAIAIQNFNQSDYNSQANDHILGKDKVLFVKDGNVLVKLPILEILYIQSDGNYLNIYLPDRRQVIRSKISDIIEKLPQDIFMQVHQRYLINKNKIDIVGNRYLQIQGVKIPVSNRYKEEVKMAVSDS
ncbi:response regulator transcription factor [bacterium]|nr:response regulator transcription factor [bacterium]